ncbi:MAG: PQQ-binding-like beta-propeller repeat protein [Candidatus Bathyarchaeota archaeon]|nr:PQQ-binding-like beta-propeller repeat protein [Candidatus Bathyarchaeota archaeon]
MQISMRKTKMYAAITMVLLMASVVLMTIPLEAQEDEYVTAEEGTFPGPVPAGETPDHTFETVAYLSFRPNPIGVGQDLLVNMWVSPGLYHAFFMHDFKVTIEDPDGNQVVRMMDSYYGDATAWFEFKPDQAGTWKLKFEQPGLWIPAPQNYEDSPTGAGFFGPPDNIYRLKESVFYTASETDWQELTVQQDYVLPWPPSDLPTDYWERPANLMHREWSPILGNYPFSGAYYYPGGRVLYASNYEYTAYVQAPNTAHVVWKRQGAISALVGGEFSHFAMTSTGGTPSIIYSGRCYQGVTKAVDGTSTSFLRCYDLRTGEVYWENPAASTTIFWFGFPITIALAPTNILYDVSAPEPVVGAEAFRSISVSLVAISGGRLYKWDPWTGVLTLNVSISPASSGTIYNNDRVLSVVNYGNFTNPNYRLLNWTMTGSTSNFNNRVLTNITWPTSGLLPGFGGGVDYDAGIAVGSSWNSPPGPQWCIGHEMEAIDLYTGDVLWTSETNDTIHESVQNPSTTVVDRGKVAFGAHGRHWTCWDARNGTKLWESELSDYPWGAWWPYDTASYDFNETKGAIIASTYEGVYAIDWDNGDIIWHYQDPDAVPFENPYVTEEGAPATPFFTGVTIADGKVYAYNGEHTTSQPVPRDWKLHCINANTGELLWQILNPMAPGGVADGYLTAGNPNDGHMYVFGKGKSATTVSAPETTVPLGTALLIKGTVLDMSPAQPGTPCVSKDSMATQMEYLHLQMPITGLWGDETITGVPVVLTAISEDFDVYDLGTVTTNGYYGTFSHAWTPPEEGVYTITASFNGDDSYGSSTAATAVSVGPAPAAPIEPEPEEEPAYTAIDLAIIAAVVVAIVIGIVNLWALRKK